MPPTDEQFNRLSNQLERLLSGDGVHEGILVRMARIETRVAWFTGIASFAMTVLVLLQFHVR